MYTALCLLHKIKSIEKFTLSKGFIYQNMFPKGDRTVFTSATIQECSYM